MKKLRYALIGCGRISPNHVAAVKQLERDLEFVAVCDIDGANMQNICETFELDQLGVKRYADYREMLEKEEIELAAIATPSGKHAEIAAYCLEHGVHLIVEKPITLSLAEADRLIELADKNQLVLCVSHQNRFNKSIVKIREAVESGAFGRMLHGTAHVRWNRSQEYYTQAPWRGTWEQDGGALMNQCIHNIDLLRWMMGDEVAEVFAYTDNLQHGYIDAEDLGLAVVKFANGAYGMIEGTTNVFPRNLEEILYLFGETGTVKAGGKSVNVIEEWLFADASEDAEAVKREYGENPPNVYGFGHLPLYRDVVDAVREKRPPAIDGRAGRRALELVLAIYKSAAEGRPVRLPLRECSTMDFKGRFDESNKRR